MGSSSSGLYSTVAYGGSPLPDSYVDEPFYIGRSLGAGAMNYDVRDPKTGRAYRFVEGTEIDNPTVFAGKGTRNKLHSKTIEGLTREFPGTRGKDWKHSKGSGVLDFNGRARRAEVHWFEEQSVGKIKFKIKRWED